MRWPEDRARDELDRQCGGVLLGIVVAALILIAVILYLPHAPTL